MKITVISNFFNHHQKPIADEFYKQNAHNFCFIATEELPEERANLGYHNMNSITPYVVCSYTSEADWMRCEKIAFESDVAIFGYGSAPLELIKRRIAKNKLTFFYMERIFKKNNFSSVTLKRKFAVWYRHNFYSKKNVYILCSSAYTSLDFFSLHLYKDKMYKWGYFPLSVCENEYIKVHTSNELNLLWVGRFIDWKHPELAILTIKRLLADGYSNLKLRMIGTGAMLQEMMELANKFHMEDKIIFLNSMSPEQVREYMKKSDILLFTSDRNEGWGAVLNEAMDSGCVPIADHMIGSVPYMIEHMNNGLIYDDNAEQPEGIVECVKKLYDDRTLLMKLSKNAIKTIREKWNANIAVCRFLNIVSNINSDNTYTDGPMSKAEIIEENCEIR